MLRTTLAEIYIPSFDSGSLHDCSVIRATWNEWPQEGQGIEERHQPILVWPFPRLTEFVF